VFGAICVAEVRVRRAAALHLVGAGH
jgi:hypothetical protein